MLVLLIALSCSPLPNTSQGQDREASSAKNDAVIEALIQACDDDSEEVRMAAVRALASIKSDHSGVLDAITAAMRDENKKVRASAIAAFKAIPGREAEKAQFVLAFLREPDDELRNAAIEQLPQYRDDLMEELCGLLVSDMVGDEQRRSLLRMFASWGPEGAPGIEAIQQVAKDNPEFRAQAIDTLAAFGPVAASAVPTLLGFLEDEDAEVRARTVHALPKLIGDAEILAAATPVVDARARQYAENLIKRYDKDGDQVLSEEEMLAFRGGERFDTNGDGKLTMTELEDFYLENLNNRANVRLAPAAIR